jgi:cytochrome c oxidase subunit IV
VAETDVQQSPQAQDPAWGPHRSRRRHGAHPSPKEYVRIAIVLGVITVAEVSTYYIAPPRSVLIPVLFVFTIVKFSMVVLWFMHLKFDSRTYSRLFIMGLAFAITLYIVVLLIFGVWG